MTKKDYIIIADALYRAIDGAVNDPANGMHTRADMRLMHTEIACKLADRLQYDNPRFDRARFLTACGVQS